MSTNEWFMEGYELPKPLSKDETYELIQLATSGSEEAREKLIIHNIRLVLNEVIKKFSKVDYDRKELVSIGNIGLLKAINTYDLSKGFEFSTYATRCIDNEILMFLRNLKKHQKTDSIDRTIYRNQDGSEIKLEDILSDSSDLVENYEQNEIHCIIRKLVEDLPDREKEIIMLHFGFYNNRIYKQREIAKKFNISQAEVSRLIAKIVKQIGKQLENIGAIDLHEKSKTKVKEIDERKMKKLRSIYEYFKDYTREDIDEMLSKLTDEEKALITLRYGENLDNPTKSKFTKEDTDNFYGRLMPKMKRLLANPTGEKKRKPRKIIDKKEDTKVLPTTSVSEEIKEEVKGNLIPKVDEKETKNNITKSDCIKMLEILRTPTFTEMMSVLTVKESIIISLKLGYVDGKYFSTEAIAQFLGIEELEVIETTKKVLLLYKENINNFLDSIIEVATNIDDKKIVLS